MTRRRWWLLALATAALLIAGVWIVVSAVGARPPTLASGPSSSPAASSGPRALTTAEAERLAVARFLAYQDGSREFRTDITTEGAVVSLHGRVDYRSGVGIAAAATGAESAVISWNATTFVGWDAIGDGESIPAQAPLEQGGARALDPEAATLDTVLLLLLGLGADRPDNAQLLQQSDAAWLRSDDIDGTGVDVFSGPSDAGSSQRGANTRFWVDDRGALLRFEADLPAGTAVIDLISEDYAGVAPVPQFG